MLEDCLLTGLPHQLAAYSDLVVHHVLGAIILTGLPLDGHPADTVVEELPLPADGERALLDVARFTGPLTPGLLAPITKGSFVADKIAAFRVAQLCCCQSVFL